MRHSIEKFYESVGRSITISAPRNGTHIGTPPMSLLVCLRSCSVIVSVTLLSSTFILIPIQVLAVALHECQITSADPALTIKESAIPETLKFTFSGKTLKNCSQER